MIGVAILGSTGSIGESTLDVLSRHPDAYYVTALSTHTRIDRLLEQCLRFRPHYAVVKNNEDALRVQTKLREQSCKTQVLVGTEGLATVASLPETQSVMAAIVGSAGLVPTLAAARAGKRILLANKESLVMSGRLLMEEVANHAAELLPIDSEHNAIFQCMPGGKHAAFSEIGVRKILLTASGGPFRNADQETLRKVTPEQACAHPNWVMGRKISVDSATMMNKGLEVIEACWLFNTTSPFVEVIIHPQSVIHSMVEYVDGSVLAQLGNPDMRTPIAHALAWPQRMESGVASLDLFDIARLDFEKPDLTRFPCLRLAYEAMEVGGTAPCVLNAANEVAVANFLEKKLAFLDIATVIEKTLTQSEMLDADSIEHILEVDRQARELAQQYVVQCSGGYQ